MGVATEIGFVAGWNEVNKDKPELQKVIVGIYSDNRDVENRYFEGDEACTTEMYTYVHSLLRFIGGYIAVLGGVDAIVFTAGVGENGAALRKLLIERLAYLGIKLDEENNKLRGKTVAISTPDSKVKVYVIPTDEEVMIAKDTMRLAFGE